MDANLQRGMLENVDMSSAIHQLQVIYLVSINLTLVNIVTIRVYHLQGVNTSVLRGIEGGTLHFITVPRSENAEFIDHVR